jgi:hypothetical protein
VSNEKETIKRENFGRKPQFLGLFIDKTSNVVLKY